MKINRRIEMNSSFHQQHKTVFALAASLTSMFAVSCSSTESSETQQAMVSNLTVLEASRSQVGDVLTAFELNRPVRDATEVNATGTEMLNLLAGKEVGAIDVSRSSSVTGTWDLSPSKELGLSLSYRGSNDFFAVTNEEVTSAYAGEPDVGEAGARALFETTFQAAGHRKLIPTVGLLTANARLWYGRQGEGKIGQAPREWVSEYRFTVPRTINGIEVLNAGFEVAVHRNGTLARLKRFGPSVLSTTDDKGTERPTANGYTFSAMVSADDIGSRVKLAYPKAIIKSVGMRYWLPPGRVSGVVEPQQVYFVVPTATVGGQEVHGRGMYVAYSVSLASTPATIWPKAASAAVGNGKKN
jgi:hypothetical protein